MAALTAREFEKARQRLCEEEERRAREADIATCECGASVRHNGREWVHVGKCGTVDYSKED